MITVKKNAIKYKDSDGQMQSAGVLCKVGVIGEDLFQYATSIRSFFSNVTFPERRKIEVNVPNANDFFHTFYYATNVSSIKISGNNNGNSINADGMFWGASDVEVIDFTELRCVLNNMGNMFRQCSKLKYVYGEIDCTNATSLQSPFMNDTLLEHMRFKKGSIYRSIDFGQQKNLTAETVQSIIDGLATVETAQTIAFHKDVKARLTDEQIATITSKNWTLA